MIDWTHAGPSLVAAFLASLVEFIEALTVVLAVGTVRGWRPALIGTGLGLLVLFLLVVILGPALARIPLDIVQLVVGTLLLLFGLRWLRKAILRFAGIVAIHDEELIYQWELAALRAQGQKRTEFDRIGAIVAYKAVLLEGTEVAFIVIAFGAGGTQALNAAIVGAIAAGIVVTALGIALRAPLTLVPENWLKFGVGAILSAFGVFWFTEGLGFAWPGDALSLVVLLAIFLTVSFIAVRMLRWLLPTGAQVAGRNV